MKVIILIGICILIVGCDIDIRQPCMVGWKNETHFCNEFHSYEPFNKWNKTELQKKLECNKRLWNSDGSFELISCEDYTKIKKKWEDKGCRFEFESCERMEQEFNQTGCITFGEVYKICCNMRKGTLIIPFLPYCDENVALERK